MKKITKEEIKKMIAAKDIESCRKYMDIFLSAYLSISTKHHWDPVNNQQEADARIFIQMMLSKALNAQHIFDGVEYSNGIFTLNKIIDPTIMYTVIRCMLELLCAFELINFIPDTSDKKEIVYQLYIISGLKKRQKFVREDLKEKYRLQLEQENKEIQDCIQVITETDYYLKLPIRQKEILKKAIKDCNYQVILEDYKVKRCGWKDILPHFGVNHDLFNEIYTYFCLQTHPSFISMVQFRDAFQKKNPKFIPLAITAMRYAFQILSIFLTDYIRLFPQIKETYKQFSEDEQYLLSFPNRLIRGDNCTIE